MSLKLGIELPTVERLVFENRGKTRFVFSFLYFAIFPLFFRIFSPCFFFVLFFVL